MADPFQKSRPQKSVGSYKVQPGCEPKAVEYLAFEGGGGRGKVYLGALEALEKVNILPIGKNQIKGIAGSSAGAITAFLLALGYTSNEILDIFKDFDHFTDDISPSIFRSISNNFNPDIINKDRDYSKGVYREKYLKPFEEMLRSSEFASLCAAYGLPIKKSSFFTNITISLYETINNLIIKTLSDNGMKGIAEKLEKQRVKGSVPQLYNLLEDGGYYTGFGVRSVLSTFLKKYFVKNKNRAGFHADITFRNFFARTKVDLRISGTNITQGFGTFFSKETTPDFPVIEAVAISGCFPIVFKPIWVDSDKEINDGFKIYDSKTNKYKNRTYKGFWIDGGVFNNLPVHAFDVNNTLNPHILALRLTPPRKQISLETIQKEGAKSSYYSSVFEMLLSPSEESQVRYPNELQQIINLDTGDLSTTDFMPARKVWEPLSQKAFENVIQFFGKSSVTGPKQTGYIKPQKTNSFGYGTFEEPQANGYT